MRKAGEFSAVLTEQKMHELAEDYEKNQQKLKEINYDSLSDDDLEKLKIYGEEKKIFSMIASAYEAIVRMAEITPDNRAVCLCSFEDYCRDICILTGEEDGLVISMIKKEIGDRAEALSSALISVFDFLKKNRAMPSEVFTGSVTVMDSLEIVKKTETMLESMGIDINNSEQLKDELSKSVAEKQKSGNVFTVEARETVTDNKKHENTEKTSVNSSSLNVKKADKVQTDSTEALTEYNLYKYQVCKEKMYGIAGRAIATAIISSLVGGMSSFMIIYPMVSYCWFLIKALGNFLIGFIAFVICLIFFLIKAEELNAIAGFLAICLFFSVIVIDAVNIIRMIKLKSDITNAGKVIRKLSKEEMEQYKNTADTSAQ